MTKLELKERALTIIDNAKKEVRDLTDEETRKSTPSKRKSKHLKMMKKRQMKNQCQMRNQRKKMK